MAEGIRVLDNGLKMMAQPMPGMASVAIGVWIRAGGRYEEKKTSGISHLLEHLLFKGTTTRDMITIKQEVEGRGGSFNGFTSEEHTCYLVKMLGKDAALAVDILSDMVLNPRMDAAEIAKEKEVIVEEIKMYKDMPSHYVHELLSEEMWPDQPLGMPLAGTEESVKAISRAELVSYKEANYDPKNIFLIAAGNIDGDSLEAMARRHLSGQRAGRISAFEKAKVSQSAPRLNARVKKTEQTHLALGLHAMDRFHPDRYAFSVMNVALGANMSSRLFHIMRDEMALCYEISSSVRRYEDCGALIVSAGLDDKKLVKAVEVMLKELSRMAREPIGADELRRAKEYYKGQLLFALEDTMSRMIWLGDRIVAGEADITAGPILKKIDAVTPDDIMASAKKVFTDNNINLAVIGPSIDEKRLTQALHFQP